jgi:hypothetical protein
VKHADEPERVFGENFRSENDFWRTQQVRNIKALEGQALCSRNDWEEVKRKGSASIEKWIDDQMEGKTCIIVLVGAETANRPWVIHGTLKDWSDKRGVLGIRINELLDVNSRPSAAGANPFSKVTFTGTSRTLAEVAPLKTPGGADSKAVYASIAINIEAWIEEAIRIRTNYS